MRSSAYDRDQRLINLGPAAGATYPAVRSSGPYVGQNLGQYVAQTADRRVPARRSRAAQTCDRSLAPSAPPDLNPA